MEIHLQSESIFQPAMLDYQSVTPLIHSLKLTWPLKMVVSNRNLLFQGSIFRGYVSFRGCNLFLGPSCKLKPSSDRGWTPKTSLGFTSSGGAAGGWRVLTEDHQWVRSIWNFRNRLYKYLYKIDDLYIYIHMINIYIYVPGNSLWPFWDG